MVVNPRSTILQGWSNADARFINVMLFNLLSLLTPAFGFSFLAQNQKIISTFGVLSKQFYIF